MKTESNLVAGHISPSSPNHFRQETYSEALTAFCLGFKDPEDLAGLLEFIAPTVWVGRRFEFKVFKDAHYFLSEQDDERAEGAGFKRVEYTGNTVNEKTLNKGLTVRIDHDQVVGDDWQERYVQMLVQRLYRNELRRAIDGLDKICEKLEFSWKEAGNPDGQVRQALLEATEKSGFRPNRLLFGEAAWDLRAHAYEAQPSGNGFRAASLSQEELARKLLVDQVQLIKARYQSGPEKKTAIVGNCVYGFYGEPGLIRDEPSHLKRFVTPVEGSERFRVYVETHAKYTDLSVEHYSNIVAGCTQGTSAGAFKATV